MHTHTLINTYSYSQIYTHKHIYIHSHASSNTCIYSHLHIHICTLTRMYTLIYAHTLTYIHSHWDWRGCTHTYKHINLAMTKIFPFSSIEVDELLSVPIDFEGHTICLNFNSKHLLASPQIDKTTVNPQSWSQVEATVSFSQTIQGDSFHKSLAVLSRGRGASIARQARQVSWGRWKSWAGLTGGEGVFLSREKQKVTLCHSGEGWAHSRGWAPLIPAECCPAPPAVVYLLTEQLAPACGKHN